jgi:hypothetical protein
LVLATGGKSADRDHVLLVDARTRSFRRPGLVLKKSGIADHKLLMGGGLLLVANITPDKSLYTGQFVIVVRDRVSDLE